MFASVFRRISVMQFYMQLEFNWRTNFEFGNFYLIAVRVQRKSVKARRSTICGLEDGMPKGLPAIRMVRSAQHGPIRNQNSEDELMPEKCDEEEAEESKREEGKRKSRNEEATVSHYFKRPRLSDKFENPVFLLSQVPSREKKALQEQINMMNGKVIDSPKFDSSGYGFTRQIRYMYKILL